MSEQERKQSEICI